MSSHRGSWGSNFGFLMAAIGSAVGLGNIWGFPYKMGISGGFTFLMVYILLAVVVGIVIMVAELAIGRRAHLGAVGTYHALAQSGGAARVIAPICGFLATLAPFLILSFYSVLGGYCMFYVTENGAALLGQRSGLESDALFSALLTNQGASVGYTLAFIAICLLIVRGGIKGGIEKFSTFAMPALAIMLVLVIVRAVTLPGAVEGLKFMFLPGYALDNGLIAAPPSFISVLSAAGGQMFFSLSLAVGIIITYGSYLEKKENLIQNALILVVADTCVALMAGLAVIPASFALGGKDAAMQGPMLLFVTLQKVFQSMGQLGYLFGLLFYILVLIAAITSAISLMEVLATFVIDHLTTRGKVANRKIITSVIAVVVTLEALIVALDGLGSNGLPSPMGFIWLDFFDLWAEGLAMPLGALLMSILLSWCVDTRIIKEEVTLCGNPFPCFWLFRLLLGVFVPVSMVFILLGQMDMFFGFGWF